MAWLDADGENRRTFDRERSMFNALQLFAPATPATAATPARRQGRLLRLVAPALRIAAVVALALGIGWGVSSYREQGWRQLSNRIVVPAGQRINLTLQDGTLVWLNAGTTLRYPALFTGPERRVEIEGEARFEVTHDAARPFVVGTYACDVEVLGTKFNVSADSERQIFSTALFEGRVAVNNRLVAGERVVLAPNDVVTLRGNHLSVGRVGNADEYLWTEGIINLTGHSFSELMARFERAFGVTIRLERIPSIRIGQGKIRQSIGIDNALQVLQQFAEFEYEKDEQSNTITIR